MKVFQKFSNFFQKATGKTCFFLARICFILCSALFGLSFLVFASFHKDGALAALSLISICCFLSIASDIQKKEDGLGSEEHFANEALETLSLFRISIVFFIFIFFLLSTAFKGERTAGLRVLKISYLFMIAGLYFVSCTPLPRGKSRIREWIESLSKLFGKKSLSLCPAKESGLV